MIDYQVFDDAAGYYSAIPQVQRLFQEVFERPFPSASWKQWYFDNPYGQPLIVMGFAAGRAVAHHALVPQQVVNAQGTVSPYMLAISSMVEKQSRNWTVFNRMMTLLHAASVKREHPLIVVLPNANSRELYRVLYHYQTVLETPLCTWKPNRGANSVVAPVEEVAVAPGEEFSYPTDARYWKWRVSLNKARCLRLTDTRSVVVKLGHDTVLTVLDLFGDRSQDDAARLAGLAQSLNAASVRLTCLHANALGIQEEELVSHEGYSVRFACRALSGQPPEIRFSLLLSDVF